MPLSIAHGDIAQFKADALVNAANSQLKEGSGICGAIFEGAGILDMTLACQTIGYCPPGGAVITPAFNLNAKHVIHAVGPVYQDGTKGEEKLLKSAYTSALRLAQQHGLQSIAFPLISSGTYGFPREKALSVAINTIRAFLDTQEDEMQVHLVLYNKEDGRLDRNLRAVLDRRLKQLRYEREEDFFISSAPILTDTVESASFEEMRPMALPPKTIKRAKPGLEEIISQMDEGFSTTLLKLIDAKNKADAQVYKRANMDRKHFSKIRGNPNYTPKKKTVLALCIALELNIGETEDLLSRAGYALSPSKKSDLIISYFIERRLYNIDDVNRALYDYDQELLGA